ncbi:YybH family protein [Croceitalea marina]|uniref:YybH family protein n=1 Tax=Croceitalea marina TaxID=1775166 RepID=A0ABW5MW47_9FLAO
MRRLFLVVFTGILLASCANEQTIVDRKQEEANLMETSREWSQSFSTDEYFSFIGEGGIMMAPGQPLLEGHEKIRNVLQEFQSLPGFKVTWEPQQALVSKSGDLGYTIDKMLMNFDDENGVTVNQFQKVVSIWKKNEKGEWKMVVDIWNADPTLTSIN